MNHHHGHRVRRHFPVRVVALLSILCCSSFLALADTAQEEYSRRLGQIGPRDVTAHYELALWCQGNGLPKAATQLLEKVIRIDPDHASARQALGYRRYGLEWRRAGSIPKSGESEADSGTDVADAGSGGKEDGTTAAAATAAEKVDRLAEKKALVAEIEEELGFKFNRLEDRDFLIYTTIEGNSRQLRDFQEQLRKIRSILQSYTGARSSTVIWPDKVAFFYLRAVECIHFCEKILGRNFAEDIGYEPLDRDILLLTRIETDELARFVGSTALDGLNGSDRWVSWWLSEGVAELVASKTDDGEKKQTYEKNYRTVGAMVEADPEAFLLKDVLEEPLMDRNNETRSRAQAMTLVDFLYESKRRSLGRFISDLKTEQVLRAPEDPRSSEFLSFFIEYLHVQEKLIYTHYRLKPEALDERWKKFVLDRRKANPTEDPRNPRQQPRGGGSGRGGGGRRTTN